MLENLPFGHIGWSDIIIHIVVKGSFWCEISQQDRLMVALSKSGKITLFKNIVKIFY